MNKLLSATPSSGPGELRRRAEGCVRALTEGSGRSEDEVARQKLLHELQVHQIELELQNEELKQAKLEVEAGLAKYTDLYDFAPVGYFTLDTEGRILELNLTGATLLGMERSVLLNRRFETRVALESRPAFRTLLERIFTGVEKQVCEIVLEHTRRTAFWASLEAKAASDSKGQKKVCRVAVMDIAARKQAEEAQRRADLLAASNRRLEDEISLRRAVEASLIESERHAQTLLTQSLQLQKKLSLISHQALVVQESQRKRISRELHDEISQLLVSIEVHLSVFCKAAMQNPKCIRQGLAPLRRLVRKSVRTVHRFARELRPAMLDDFGLIPALRFYIEEFPKRKGRRIQFTADSGVETLDTDRRTVLYRIAQEALTNVDKHAQASLIKVSVLRSRGCVCLEVADDGRAFDVERLSSVKWSGRLGLTGMRERVEMVGGQFNVISAPGTGTTVRAEIPFGDGG